MKDPVTPQVALYVLRRDQGCVAPRLAGSTMDCFGRNRLEHVKPEPRMGRRAASCPCSLMTLCEGHTEAGMRAGFVWATANRRPCRLYLASFQYGEHHAGHVAEILTRVAA